MRVIAHFDWNITIKRFFLLQNCYRESAKRGYSNSFALPDHYEPHGWDPDEPEEADEDVYPLMGPMKRVFDTIDEEFNYK